MKRIKIGILGVGILGVCVSFFGTSFAYTQDKLFCTISTHSITVTIDRQSNYKCDEYITVLRQAINKEYRNVLSIQELIDQNYDVEFWFAIREQKREQIKKMIIMKTQIEDAILEFQENLFEKTKEYIVFTVSPYRIRYKRLLKPLNDLGENTYLSARVRKKINLMQEQIEVINEIMLAEDYELLIKKFNRYIYLKNQIEGK
ncbi:MAG TPA: hypothetical protein P5060_03220 [Candidatus Absconditabacterales bacterium]|nr:hypothetical protein [Candidatus Absconditabacterales bacterium]